MKASGSKSRDCRATDRRVPDTRQRFDEGAVAGALGTLPEMLDHCRKQRMHGGLPLVVHADQTGQDRVLGEVRHPSQQLDQLGDGDSRQLREAFEKRRVGRSHRRQ